MPIGFADLLQTNSQYVNGLNKGIVSTDDSFGGIRSKIDDWTDLHLSTKTNDNNVTYYTFQDDGTNAAPGQFKEYSTMFYVADGRALVEDSSAGANFIRLDGSGNFVSSGGTKYVVPSSGSAEPEFWVLDDATQTGGSGIGTDKLPKFTITGTQGSDSSTAIPAGYQKLRVLANAASSDGAVSLSATLDSNLLSNTAGELGLDTQNANIVFAGPSSGGAAAPSFRSLVSADIPNNAANTTGTAAGLTNAGTITFTGDVIGGTTPTYTSGGNLSIAMTIQPSSVGLGDLVDIADERLLGRVDNATSSVAELTATQVRTMLNVADGANNYAHPTFDGDDIDVDTGALTGAEVVSDIDINITTDTNGHVTDANGTIATRTLTLSDLGYTGASDANNYVHPDHTGDVTSSADGATTIADEAVTLAKMAHIATASFLGRNSAGTNDVEVLNMTTAKSMLSVDDLVTLSGVSDGAINLGAFTASTVLSSSTLTIKGALQALADQVDSNSSNSGTTNLSVGTSNATSLILSSSTQDNSGVTIPVHAENIAGIITDASQTIYGDKTFNDNVTITGSLTVTDSTSYVNIQEENVYIKDALITLGITDADGDGTGTVATSDVGIEAYGQGVSSTSPTLVYDISADYWAIDNKDHASSALTRIARTYKEQYTIAAGDVTAGYFEITHNLNHEDIIVQVRDNATDQGLVIFKYQTMNAQTVRIAIGNGVTATTVFNVVIVG
jgi:hypothetical protein